MRLFLLGLLVGVILAFLFMYTGGGRVLKLMGAKAVKLGEQMEHYQRAVKEVLPKR